MIGDIIRLVLTNVMAITFAAAMAWAAISPVRGPSRAGHFLDALLVALGLQGLWSGLYNTVFQQTSARFIGWPVSPFQFEIGCADIALGMVSLVAAWRSLDFKAAAVLAQAIFFAGVSIGHVRQYLATGDAAPGNFGLMLVLTLVQTVLMVALYLAAARARKAGLPRAA